MKLTESNYYSPEANQEYMSASLVKAMLTCEAAAIAECDGTWKRPWSEALLVGGFMDSLFDNCPGQYAHDHPEIRKRDGTLKAEYIKCMNDYNRVRQDGYFNLMTSRCEHQKILTGSIGGVPFKAKLDFYAPGDRIVDLKTVRSFDPVYLPGEGRVSFADAWRWPLQMAIYQKLEGHGLPCYLACITKEEPCDFEIVEIPQAVMDAEMELLMEKLPRLEAVWRGIIEPERCGHCVYCRQTKELTGPKSLTEYEYE